MGQSRRPLRDVDPVAAVRIRHKAQSEAARLMAEFEERFAMQKGFAVIPADDVDTIVGMLGSDEPRHGAGVRLDGAASSGVPSPLSRTAGGSVPVTGDNPPGPLDEPVARTGSAGVRGGPPPEQPEA